jgi:hypothetical protein
VDGTGPSSKNLVAGTVPSSKNLVAGSVPSSKNLVAGTVPYSKNLVDDTSIKWLSSKLIFDQQPIDPRVVRTPWYKNFVESFFNGLTAVHQAMLDSALLYHYSAGLSWSNIGILCT